MKVGAAVLSALEDSNGVGVSTAIVRGGEWVDARCAGWEDLAAGVAASGQTRYRWASVAKPLTAVAALQLVETGVLDLHADVRALVPEFPDKGHAITAHHLLARQAGLRHQPEDAALARPRDYDVAHPWAHRVLCLDLFRDAPLIAAPGSRFSYSTNGYLLLGVVVERAGERTYEEQVHARILEPLGMGRTQPDYPWIDVPHRAVGYRGLRIGLATLDEDRDVSWKLPAGGWISTIEDAGRFAAGLLGDDLLAPKTREEMFQTRVPGNGRDPSYGCGVGTWRLDGRSVVSHSGNQSKASTFLLLCPEEDLGVVVLSNTSNLDTAALARELFGVVCGSRDR